MSDRPVSVPQRVPPSVPPSVPLIIPALLVAASSVSILSTDLYTPSLPHLQSAFDTDAATVQLTMSLNLAGFAVAQLFYGPLSDRVGRRPVLLGGLIGFALASLACALAPDIESLIAARLLQGVLACAEAVIGLVVIRDLYDDDSGVRVMGAYGMAVALAPAVGPMIGGQIHVWLGWQANFWLIAALVAVVALLVWRHLPETLERPDPEALRPARLLRGYLGLLGERRFMGYVLVAAITLGGLFAFITDGPFVYIEDMGVATEHYGVYYAAPVLAYFFGSLAVNRAAGRWPADRLLAAGLAIAAVGGLGCLALVAAAAETPISLTVAVSVLTFAMGFIFATAPIRAFAVCGAGRGLAAALFGAAEMAGAGLGALAVGLLHDGTAGPLAMVLGGATLLALAVFLLAAPWRAPAALTTGGRRRG